MKVFFIISKIFSPFILSLGLLQISFIFLLLFSKVSSRILWSLWGSFFWLLSTPFLSDWLISYWEIPLTSVESIKPYSCDAIVVLGGMVEGKSEKGQWQLGQSVDRLTESLKLYNRDVAPYIIMAGGNNQFRETDSWSESEIMRKFFIEAKVPQKSLIVEKRSQNTFQNVLYLEKIFKELGLKNLLLVTSAYHMPRSLAIFQKRKIQVTPFSTDSRRLNIVFPLNMIPNQKALANVDTIWREVIGYYVYYLSGYL